MEKKKGSFVAGESGDGASGDSRRAGGLVVETWMALVVVERGKVVSLHTHRLAL